MKDEEILKKAIEKAVKDGYKPSGVLGAVLRGEIGIGLDPNIYKHLMKYNHYYVYIFSHDFAKAYWGDDYVNILGRTQHEQLKIDRELNKQGSLWGTFDFLYNCFKSRFKLHLQHMVLAKDKFKYLERFL